MSIHYRDLLLVVLAFSLANCHLDAQQWKTDVGFTQLSSEFGSGLETGLGVSVMFAEVANGGGDYLPNVTSSNFGSKTFVYGSGPSATNSHSNSMSTNFYGSVGSIAPEVGDDPLKPVTAFEANDWINFGMGYATGSDPNLQPYAASNHSYIATLGGSFTEAVAVDLLERLDFSINQTEMTTLVGSSNSTGGQLPALWVHGYNCITVGVTDGTHAASETAPTYLYGDGRIKPEIVAPSSVTSFSTPMVASAAALLHEAGAGTDAVRSETMKAILLAGATKDEFDAWSRTPTQPLDLRFGAGELNVYNSYYIQAGGEFDGQTGVPVSSVALNGWDYEPEIIAGSDRFYELVVPENTLIDELSILLTWNMAITDADPSGSFLAVQSLADMNLTLSDSDNGFESQVVDFSDSEVDNIEHIYLKNLMPGTYHFRVNSDMDMDFGIAWRGSTQSVPMIAALGRKLLDGLGIAGSLGDTTDSDDTYYSLTPSPTSNFAKQKIDMIVVAETTVTDPGFVGFRYEASMVGGPSGDVIQQLRLFDVDNRKWEIVDVTTATNTDLVVKYSATGDISRFVNQQTGEIIAKMTWLSPGFTGSPFAWTIDVDQAGWQIAD
ncbi:MAG: hypothetical protein GY819_15410 [Planctomycetaceae bacterium]|nr:hypothetical protein [Planctomycetaceae bacterium]